jgi:putative hydrolase of the HAD superfamily
MPLFKNEFYKCVLGEMNLKEVLKSYIPIWNWGGTVDELLQYWWEGENKLNTPVLEVITQLRAEGAKCYLATDQEKYRANYIMKGMGLEKYIDGAFFSSDLGISKGDRKYWEKVLSILHVENPSEVHYWDDEIENIEAAQDVGIQTHLYQSISDLGVVL